MQRDAVQRQSRLVTQGEVVRMTAGDGTSPLHQLLCSVCRWLADREYAPIHASDYTLADPVAKITVGMAG